MPIVIVPVRNLRLKCPKCGNQTHYARFGYDGEKGEGQYCDNCKDFISNIIQRHFPIFIEWDRKKLDELREELQRAVDEAYQNRKGENH